MYYYALIVRCFHSMTGFVIALLFKRRNKMSVLKCGGSCEINLLTDCDDSYHRTLTTGRPAGILLICPDLITGPAIIQPIYLHAFTSSSSCQCIRTFFLSSFWTVYLLFYLFELRIRKPFSILSLTYMSYCLGSLYRAVLYDKQFITGSIMCRKEEDVCLRWVKAGQ